MLAEAAEEDVRLIETAFTVRIEAERPIKGLRAFPSPANISSTPPET
jgi:hypothetical protein